MIQANYFDGGSTRVRPVELSIDGEYLVINGENLDLRMSFAAVKVDERLGRAPRRLHLQNGAFCEVRDLNGLDALLSLAGHQDGWVDRMQRHLQFVLFAIAACAVLAVIGYRWALPWAAAEAARRLPLAVGTTLSVQALKLLDGSILLPSKIAAGHRQELSDKYHALRLPGGGNPDSELLFRDSPQLGANAFTLPDGSIIMLDDLITAMDDDHLTLAVIAHELGHAHGRHGLQMLLQSSAVGAFWTFYIGDISNLLAAAPAAIVQSKYSQDLERQADDYGASVLIQNGMSPARLADALTKLAAAHPGTSDAGYLSSHPSTAERMRHLRYLPAPP